MTFKEMVRSDALDVFCNMEEYGERHKWDSTEITCMPDNDSLMRRYSEEFATLPKGSHLVFVPASQLPRKPMPGTPVRFDGVLYTVDEAREDMGMYAVYLGRGKL